MLSVGIGILSYNEAKSLPAIIERLIETTSALADVRCHWLIINNGSTDATETVAQDLEKKYSNVSHCTIAVNQGYGYGVRTGLAGLAGDIVGYMWGDNQFDAKIVADMIGELAKNNQLELIKTYRAKRYDGSWRKIISRFYQIIFRILYWRKIRDINAGPKLMRRALFVKILPLKSNDWFIDAEIMIKATRQLKPEQMIEVPMNFYPRQFGKSNVRWRTCFEFLFNLIHYRFISK